MPKNDLFDYMRDATHQMQSEYERIQKRATEDPGTAGDNGEENWAALLRLWLPQYYSIVTKGRIMNSEGECSPQIDVLVLSPSYPKALLGKKEYLEGGVVAAFECKLTLTAEHIREAVKTSAKIHRLSEQRRDTPYKELHSRIRYGLLAHSHVWKGEKSTPIDNVQKHLSDAEGKETNHPREQIDVICISDLATWNTSKMIFAGQQILSALEIRYKGFGKLWQSIQSDGGVIETVHTCFAAIHQEDEEKKKLFTPIGSFLTKILEMLAWEDVNLRPIADYFINSNILGAGVGECKIGSLGILSDELADKIRKGNYLINEGRWDEWKMYF